MKTSKIKRFVSTLLSIAMVFGMLSVSADAKSFADISSSHPSLDAINYVSDNGIMLGMNSSGFSPNATVTRAIVVTTLYRKAGSPAVSGANKFTDVSSTDYFYNAVLWATSKGIINGTTTTTFSPHTKITRQDAAVMLYRLGENMGYDVSKTTSITGFSDYSSVGSYARTAMAWGHATGVVPAVSGKLSPKSDVTRAQLAEFVTAYGTNVEKIIHGKDNFRFTNYDTSEKRYITTAHYNKLYSLIQAAYGTSDNGNFQHIKDRLNKNCTGMCYGMCVVVMLDKLGKIAFNENYSNEKDMYGIKGSTVRKTTVESALNYHHVSSSLPGANHSKLKAPISDQVTDAVNVMMNSNQPCLFEYYYKRLIDGEQGTAGHEVIVNFCKKNGTSYTLDIIDPNGPTHIKKTLTADGKLGSTQLIALHARNDYSFYDRIDIDTYKNTDTSSNSPATIPMDDTSISPNRPIDAVQYADKFSTLEVELYGNFKIQDDTGAFLQWDGVNLTGTMETYDVWLLPQGDNYAAIMCIDVPLSNNYYFDSLTEGMNVWFSVADQYRYSRVSGSGLTSIEVHQQGEMEIDCSNTSFEVAYGMPNPDKPLLGLSGSGNGHVVAKCDGEVLKATGDIGDYTISSIDSTGNLLYNQTVTVLPREDTASGSSPEMDYTEPVDSAVLESTESVLQS